MFGRKLTMRDELLERVGAEVLLAARVSEDEVTATAGSPDIYAGLRIRIANGREQQSHNSNALAASIWHTMRWPLSVAAAILLLIVVAMTLLQPKSGLERAGDARPVLDSATPDKPNAVEQTPAPPSHEPAAIAAVHSGSRRKTASYGQPRLSNHNNEVATDFLPLTFVADSTVQESGHVVRVSVPRSALIAFGLPMNVERASEFIMADVVIGDDGLARAIRFVQ